MSSRFLRPPLHGATKIASTSIQHDRGLEGPAVSTRATSPSTASIKREYAPLLGPHCRQRATRSSEASIKREPAPLLGPRCSERATPQPS